jgi:predicted cupin superfamily sugar epimerase
MLIDLRDPTLSATDIRTALQLAPHPEGGWYRETWRDRPADPRQRGAATAIFFLLAAGEESAVHKVDAAEVWVWQAGAPLFLQLGDTDTRLGPDLAAGERLQGVVPAGVWQSAKTAGAWTLVTCIVAPAFEFSGFTLKG